MLKIIQYVLYLPFDKLVQQAVEDGKLNHQLLHHLQSKVHRRTMIYEYEQCVIIDMQIECTLHTHIKCVMI